MKKKSIANPNKLSPERKSIANSNKVSPERKSIANSNKMSPDKKPQNLNVSNNNKRRGSFLTKDETLSFGNKSNIGNHFNRKSNFVDKTKISNVSEKTDFDIKEDFEINKTNLLVDKIITSYGESYNIKNKNKSDKIQLNIGLDQQTNDNDLLKKVSVIDKNLLSLTLTSPREEGDKYELVEKHYIDNLRKENDDLSSNIKKMMDNMEDMKKTFRKTGGEANILQQVNESSDKLSSDNKLKVTTLNNQIRDATVMNNKLKEILTREKLDKDSQYRALINLTKQYDESLSEELVKLYQSFNNQYFLAKFNPIDEQSIENYLVQIDLLEKEILSKNTEIKDLNKLIINEKKKLNNGVTPKKETLSNTNINSNNTQLPNLTISPNPNTSRKLTNSKKNISK